MTCYLISNLFADIKASQLTVLINFFLSAGQFNLNRVLRDNVLSKNGFQADLVFKKALTLMMLQLLIFIINFRTQKCQSKNNNVIFEEAVKPLLSH
jgi:hypothetical protein